MTLAEKIHLQVSWRNWIISCGSKQGTVGWGEIWHVGFSVTLHKLWTTWEPFPKHSMVTHLSMSGKGPVIFIKKYSKRCPRVEGVRYMKDSKANQEIRHYRESGNKLNLCHQFRPLPRSTHNSPLPLFHSCWFFPTWLSSRKAHSVLFFTILTAWSQDLGWIYWTNDWMSKLLR